MKKYKLTLNPDEFRKIYHLDESKSKLKSVKFYWPLVLGVLALIAGIYRLIDMSDERSEVLTLLITFGFAVYMFDKYWRDRKAITSRIKNVEEFIRKNEAFENTSVSIDNGHFILEQDEEFSKMKLEEVTEIRIVETHATLTFKGASFIIPKESFVEGQWTEFLDEIKEFS